VFLTTPGQLETFDRPSCPPKTASAKAGHTEVQSADSKLPPASSNKWIECTHWRPDDGLYQVNFGHRLPRNSFQIAVIRTNLATGHALPAINSPKIYG
jgi:hypothetical protein